MKRTSDLRNGAEGKVCSGDPLKPDDYKKGGSYEKLHEYYMTSEGSAITFLVNFELVSSIFGLIAFVWYKCNERAGDDDSSTTKSTVKH